LNLLDFNRDHRSELEVLSDAKTLFLLSLIYELKRTSGAVRLIPKNFLRPIRIRVRPGNPKNIAGPIRRDWVLISAVLSDPKNIHTPKRCAVRSSVSARHPQVRELWENIERHNPFR
jgi:hypothetical protein